MQLLLKENCHNMSTYFYAGIVKAKLSLNREAKANHSFWIYVNDCPTSGPRLTASASIDVTVLDVNDERPRFTLSTFTFGVEENQPSGTVVGMPIASDADAPPYNQFSYLILGEGTHPSDLFSIDRKSGRVTTNRVLDREVQSVYQLTVVAKDDHSISLSSTAQLVINVADVNDCVPVSLLVQ